MAVLQTVATLLREIYPSIDVVMVFLPELETLRCALSCGMRATIYRALRIRRDDLGHVLAIAARTGYRAVAQPTMIPGDRSGLAIPLIHGHDVQAVFYVASRTEDLSPVSDMLVTCIDLICAPYMLACDRERDRTNALYDGLTGLLTPRAFRAQFHDDLQSINVRDNTDLSLWFIDTDDFKKVNDTLGHGAGDMVLQQMAALLRAHASSEHDVPARNGGDEFCMLMRGTPKTRAITRAQAFCVAVREHDFGVGFRLSASLGVASYPYDGTSSSALLEIADGAMYHSKHAGRSRVSFAIEPGRFAVYAQ